MKLINKMNIVMLKVWITLAKSISY